MSLPWWLSQGSPTPFELGLKGINKEMALLAGARLPQVSMGLDRMGDTPFSGAASGSGADGLQSKGQVITNNYTLNVDSMGTPVNIVEEFEFMRIQGVY